MPVGLSLQQSGVDSWQHTLLSVERGLFVLDVGIIDTYRHTYKYNRAVR